MTTEGFLTKRERRNRSWATFNVFHNLTLLRVRELVLLKPVLYPLCTLSSHLIDRKQGAEGGGIGNVENR